MTSKENNSKDNEAKVSPDSWMERVEQEKLYLKNKKTMLLGFPKLYKYISLSCDCEIEGVSGLFKNHQLLFKSPNDFNDPFEFKINSLEEFDGKVMKEFAKKIIIKKNKEYVSGNELEKMVMENIDSWKKSGGFIKFLKERENKCRVCCLSEKRDDILMWSHYADSHNGICIEFSFTMFKYLENLSTFDGPLMVEYSSSLPSINKEFLKGKEISTILSSILVNKAKNWEYERDVE